MFRVQLEAYLDDHPEFLESYIARIFDKTSLGKLRGTKLCKDSEQNNSFQQTSNFSHEIIDWFTDIVNERKCVYFKKEEVKSKISSLPLLDQDFSHLRIMTILFKPWN